MLFPILALTLALGFEAEPNAQGPPCPCQAKVAQDVATASRYKRPDGGYRYLYLINNAGSLVRFKARRDIDPNDPAALLAMPARPRLMLDWLN